MKKKLLNILRILVSIAALAILFWQIGLGETIDILSSADFRYLFVAFLIFILNLVIRAYRWYVLIRSLDPSVRFAKLLRLYFVGQFFNSFLPTGFGGDVIRAFELTQDTDASASIGTVVLDRMSGLLVLFMMGLGALPFRAADLNPLLTWILIVVAGGGLVAGALILEGNILRKLTAWLPGKLSLVGEGTLARTYAAVTGCGWRAIMRAFAVSLVFNVLNVVVNWLCGRAVGMNLSLGYFLAVTPLISVSLLVPSVGGWGVREAVSTAVFSPAGVDANVAAAMGVAMGGVGLAAGFIGGGLYLFGTLRQMTRRDDR